MDTKNYKIYETYRMKKYVYKVFKNITYQIKLIMGDLLRRINYLIKKKRNFSKSNDPNVSLDWKRSEEKICLLGTCSEALSQIKGIKLTPKEIDVIAGLMSGKASLKAIASFLYISPKTAEVHIRNIKLKLDCNTREDIIKFIEKAEKFSALRQHYLFLCLQEVFKKKLQHLSLFVDQSNFSSVIFYEKQYELFIGRLRQAFKFLGIEVIFRPQETHKSLQKCLEEIDFHPKIHYLCVISSLWIKQLCVKETLLTQHLQSLKNLTFISVSDTLEEKVAQGKEELPSVPHIHFEDSAKYYLSFFELFKRLFPEVTLDNLSSELKKYYNISDLP